VSSGQTAAETVLMLQLADAAMRVNVVTCPGCSLNNDLIIRAASANQMLTGSLILFAAVLSRWILGRRLNKLHYMGCATLDRCLVCMACRCKAAGTL